MLRPLSTFHYQGGHFPLLPNQGARLASLHAGWLAGWLTSVQVALEQELGEALLRESGDVGLEPVPVAGRFTQVDQEMEIVVLLS